MSATAVLERLEQGLRVAAARRREAIPTDGFTAYLWPGSDNPFLSLAIPVAAAPADPVGALHALRAVFESRGRVARFECMAELHPELLGALERGGFERQMEAAAMVLDPADLPGPPPSAGAYRPLDPRDRVRMEAVARGATLAFGGEGGARALDIMPALLSGMEEGTILAAAVEVDGAPVSGASIVFGGDVAELAGVWTHPAHRRLGLARQVCHALLTAALERGAELVWLAAEADALTLYEQLGFLRVGTQVNAGAHAPG